MVTRTQLTEKQVAKLFDFVKSKFVRFEDLKYELVDHLASSIEDIQEKEPSKTFDTALKETYSRFPITGFTNFVAEKQKALSRYWSKILLRHILAYFKLPKIILLSALNYFIWALFQHLPHAFVLIPAFLLLFLSFVFSCKRMMKNKKEYEKHLFLQAYQAVTIGSLYWIVFVPVQMASGNVSIVHFMGISLNNYVAIALSILIALTLIISHIILNILPDILKQEVEKKYAHLNIKLA